MRQENELPDGVALSPPKGGDKNLVVSSTFFRHKQSLELKWLVRWHPELRGAMKEFELITPEWKPEDIDEDYEPPKVEKALEAIVEVMNESDQLDAKIAKGNNGKIPSRIQTLDVGESFESNKVVFRAWA